MLSYLSFAVLQMYIKEAAGYPGPQGMAIVQARMIPGLWIRTVHEWAVWFLKCLVTEIQRLCIKTSAQTKIINYPKVPRLLEGTFT